MRKDTPEALEALCGLLMRRSTEEPGRGLPAVLQPPRAICPASVERHLSFGEFKGDFSWGAAGRQQCVGDSRSRRTARFPQLKRYVSLFADPVVDAELKNDSSHTG